MTQERQKERDSPLKKRREELGLTQRDIALALDKTVQTISNWETGIYSQSKSFVKTLKDGN
jgi:transcriptional regulator with XRE-family HTH domain